MKNQILLLLLAFILSQCTSRKKMVYFQGAESVSLSTASQNPLLCNDDLLSITVLGLDPEAVKPFNLPIGNYNMNQGTYTSGTQSPPGYLIDSNGEIDFPVLGRIKLAGLTRSAASALLKERLQNYIKEPTILMRIMNFKITVLGEVRNPGTFTIPNERITLPEALGIAGDLNITARRKTVLVVREENGKVTETRVDLTSKDLFKSHVYFLKQNDLIYVEPNKAKINSSVVNPANIGLVISIVSLFVTISVLFVSQ